MNRFCYWINSNLHYVKGVGIYIYVISFIKKSVNKHAYYLDKTNRLHICTSCLLYKEYSDHKIYIVLYLTYDGVVCFAYAIVHNNHAYRIRSTESSYTKARQFQLDDFAICSRVKADGRKRDV